MMEIDEASDESVSANLHRFALFNCRVHTSRTQCTDLVLTKGPTLYEMKSKHILTSCDLSNTVLKETTIRHQVNSANVRLNVYFSYKKKTKEIYYFLKIDDHMIILGKFDEHFVIKRELEYIKEYRVFDANCTGECTVELQFINGSTESFELAILSSLKHSNLRSDIHETQHFDKLKRAITDRVAEAESKLVDIEHSMQKEFTEYVTKCQFISNSLDENAVALARYGDIWVKNCNEQIVIGIPVYNCSIKKYLIENIRASLFCRNQSQLLYTQSCYEFRMENNRITPSNIADMGDDPRQFDHIAFEDDWTNRKNAVLYADTAAIIVLKTNLTHFNETNSFVLDAIILYRVIDETEKSMELQLHAGTIELDTDLLYDPYYSIQFDKAHVFPDLLAVVATTSNRRIEIAFDEEYLAHELHNIFTVKLCFDEIAIASKPSAPDLTENFLSTQRDLASPTNDAGEQKMFYQRHDGYWNGTLIRVHNVIDPNSSAEYRYHLKIYNKLNEKIDGLIRMLSNEFGRKMIITSPSHERSKEPMESALRQNFRQEKAAVHELATSLRTKQCDEAEAHRKFIDAQYKTDIALSEINKF